MREGWTYKKLNELCEVITKGTTPTTLGYTFSEFGVNFIKIESISTNRKLFRDKLNYISEECNKSMSRSQLQESDILFSIAGALGRIYIVEKSVLPANTNQALAIIRLKDKQDLFLQYISYYLSSNTLKRQIDIDKVGVAQLNLSLSQIKNFIIPIPSLSEQQSIVAELDKINELISLKKAQLSDLDNLAQSIFYDMFGDPIENEKGWEVKKLGEACSLKAGKSIKASDLVEKKDNIFPCYGGNGIRGYIDRFSHEMDLPIIGRQGALCGNVNFAKGPFYATEHAVVVTPVVNLDVVWLYYILKGLRLENYAHGVAQPGISVGDLNPIPLPIPPLPLQQEFAKRIELIEQQKAQISSTIKDLETLLASRMQHWFD